VLSYIKSNAMIRQHQTKC